MVQQTQTLSVVFEVAYVVFGLVVSAFAIAAPLV